ncbi:hypothetical protein [Nocardia abscessus]|uniref:hypothetical protein n=1 Tax=Nocardia abscessus TaxID=120957 RepID=UPI002458B2AD|nr:hypothetical protein [Nocardia abscessus]
MADHKFITDNLDAAIASMSVPAITIWNRLEGRPRTDNFERALRAEVRDPLWMLTRQWQLGEFQGDDAGSPFFAKAHLETTQLHKYRPANGPVEDIDKTLPLEPHVEKMPVPFEQSGNDISLDIRLLMGRQWIKMIAPLAPASVPQFLDAYPLRAPDPTNLADAPTCAHPEAWSNFAAAHGRLMDGAKLYEHLTDPAHRISDGIPALTGLEVEADAIAERYTRWFRRLLSQPEGPSAWRPDRLEYRFAASAPHAQGEKVLTADEYFHGHLDWYNFDVDTQRDSLGTPQPAPPVPVTLTMLPTQVTFNGMPNTRWWKFEDSRTNFGDIKPDTTDLAKLLLIEFGLVYANDWFLTPFTLPAGSIANIRGLAVTNVFGERTWVEAAGRGPDDDWQRWAMFLVSIQGKGDQSADLSLFVPPVVQQNLDGRPMEEVLFVRDEMANMVWGIERTILLPSGEPRRGREAADETQAFFERDLERRLGTAPQPVPFADGAKIRYKVMSTVPENWIPMIPVHIDSDNRETQLQRAAMARTLIGETDPPRPIRPRTSLLRAGLEQTPAEKYLLHEEEVPRSGARVTQSFQRTRTRTGQALTWLGVRKQTGRGEGSSGLAFDRIAETK